MPRGSTYAWRRLRLWVLRRDDWRCQVLVDDAGQPTDDGSGHRHLVELTTHDRSLQTHAHVDHVVELSAGGTDDPGNLRAACQLCNLRRAAAQTNGTRVRPLNSSRSW